MTDDLKILLSIILDAQEGCQKLLIDVKIQLGALKHTMIALDPRTAPLISAQIETLTEKHREILEEEMQRIGLLRATVSKMVH